MQNKVLALALILRQETWSRIQVMIGCLLALLERSDPRSNLFLQSFVQLKQVLEFLGLVEYLFEALG